MCHDGSGQWIFICGADLAKSGHAYTWNFRRRGFDTFDLELVPIMYDGGSRPASLLVFVEFYDPFPVSVRTMPKPGNGNLTCGLLLEALKIAGPSDNLPGNRRFGFGTRDDC